MNTKNLQGAFNHSQTSLMLAGKEIQKLKADIAHLLSNGDTGAGRLDGLGSIVQGSRVKFAGTDDGVVVGFMGDPTKGMDDKIVEYRIVVKHDCGSESFHTYRHDGRSIHSACHDIVEVINKP